MLLRADLVVYSGIAKEKGCRLRAECVFTQVKARRHQPWGRYPKVSKRLLQNRDRMCLSGTILLQGGVASNSSSERFMKEGFQMKKESTQNCSKPDGRCRSILGGMPI